MRLREANLTSTSSGPWLERTRALIARGYDVTAADMSPDVVGQNLGGVTVCEGTENDRLIEAADLVIMTGMTLPNRTLPHLIETAKRYNTSTMIWAVTGKNFGHYYTEHGIDCVISDPSPFFLAWPYQHRYLAKRALSHDPSFRRTRYVYLGLQHRMEDSPMRVTCVVKRYQHHTASGGYDRLAAALGANVIVRKQIPGLFGKAANKVWRHLTPRKDYLSTTRSAIGWLSYTHWQPAFLGRPMSCTCSTADKLIC